MATEAAWSDDESKAEEHQGLPEPREARRGARNRASLRAFGGNHACQHLEFELLASRTTRKYTSAVLGHPARGTWFRTLVGEACSGQALYIGLRHLDSTHTLRGRF